MIEPKVFSVSAFISHAQNFDRAAQLVQRDMARKLAGEIERIKASTQRGEFSTRYQLDVIVMTPDEFYRAVEDFAQRRACSVPQVLFGNDGVTT